MIVVIGSSKKVNVMMTKLRHSTFHFFKQVLVLFVMLVTACVVNVSVPIPAQALNFSEAYQKLLDNNLSYRRAKLDHQADKMRVAQARAELLPNVQLSAGTGYVKTDDQTLANSNTLSDSTIVNSVNSDGFSVIGRTDVSFDERRRDEASLRLTQPIYNRNLSMHYRQSKSRALESKWRLQRILEQQLGELSQFYFGYLQAKASLEVAERELNAVNDHRKLTVERYESGLGTLADVHESISRFKVAQVEMFDALEAKQRFEGRLQRLIRVEKQSLDMPTLDTKAVAVERKLANVETLIKQQLDNTIAVQLQQQVMESAKLAVKADKAERLPRLDLIASTSRSETEGFEAGDDVSNRDERIMLELNIPLFSGFGNTAKVKEARYRYQAEQIELENTKQLQQERIAEAYRTKRKAFKKMQALEEAFISSSKALELRKEGYIEGITSNLDVLNAYRDKHRSERTWQQGSFDYLVQMLRLDIALGNVDLKSVEYLDQYLMNKPDKENNVTDFK